MKWCGPIAIRELTGRKVTDREMRTIDILCYIEKYLGRGTVVAKDIRGKTLSELPSYSRALLCYAGHVVPMINGSVSNLNGFSGEPVNFVVVWNS